MNDVRKNNDVIIACDFSSRDETMEFLKKFGDRRPYLKIGMELFYSEGMDLVDELKARGHKIFLDLKLHDIPNTVEHGMAALAEHEVDMCNVHVAGTVKMMEAAVRGLARKSKNNAEKKPGERPLIIGVTQLTSTDQRELEDELMIRGPMEEIVAHYSGQAKLAGLDGVVCSPLEAPAVHDRSGEDFLTVTPGIRLAGDSPEDQKRITTPSQARDLGADMIVVGRSITAASDPLSAYEECVRQFMGEEKLADSARRTGARSVAEALLDTDAVILRPEEPFTWASGIKSPIYCDNRLVLSDPANRRVIEEALIEMIEDRYPDAEALFGTATAGISHAAIAAYRMDIPMGYVRSKAKDHGKESRIEGRIRPGMKVVVVEDLISTGGSVCEAAAALREAGAEVIGLVSIFTYGIRRSQEAFDEAGLKYASLVDLDTLVETAEEMKILDRSQVEEVLLFRDSL